MRTHTLAVDHARPSLAHRSPTPTCNRYDRQSFMRWRQNPFRMRRGAPYVSLAFVGTSPHPGVHELPATNLGFSPQHSNYYLRYVPDADELPKGMVARADIEHHDFVHRPNASEAFPGRCNPSAHTIGLVQGTTDFLPDDVPTV